MKQNLDIKYTIAIISAILLVFFILYFIQRHATYWHGGILLSSIELFSYILCLGSLMKRLPVTRFQKPQRVKIALFLAFISFCFIGDILWHASHYAKLFSNSDPIIVGSINFAFSVAFICWIALFGCVARIRSLSRIQRVKFILFIIFVGGVGTFLFTQSVGIIHLNQLCSFLTVSQVSYIFFNGVTSLILLFIFIFSQQPYWTFMSAGLLTMFLIGAEIVVRQAHGLTLDFDYYEFIYGFGLVLFAVFMVIEKSFKRIYPIRMRSVQVEIKVVLIFTTFLAISVSQVFVGGSVDRFIYIGAMCSTGILISGIFSAYINQRLADYGGAIIDILNKTVLGDRTQSKGETYYTELQHSYNTLFRKQIHVMNQVILNEQKARTAEAIKKNHAQIAHDIRSPLAALDMALPELSTLPEDIRLLVRSSVSRIRDIANKLLESPPSKSHVNAMAQNLVRPEPIEKAEVVLLSSMIDSLISEKRYQFRSKMGIEIQLKLCTSSYGLFADFQPIEFRRAISNLINNAVEALEEGGNVTLELAKKDGKIEILCTDTGKGIAPEILSKLGQRGETHGKEGGLGLGLYHAKKSLQNWGGDLQLESQVGKGTVVILTLPNAPPPVWFVPELRISPQTSVIILDDDVSIHQIWDGRFENLSMTTQNIEIKHFSIPGELKSWVIQNAHEKKSVLYLVDYELLGLKETGLDLIEELGIASQSVLVTSRFEEKQILETCEKLGVGIVPKSMAAFVPLSVVDPPLKPDFILIDDDPLVQLSWRLAAESSNQSMLGYSNADGFFKNSDQFDLSVPVYVDVSLGEGISGEGVARKIFDLGFNNVFLTTGYEAERYRHLTFLKGVVGKSVPWKE